MSADVVEAVDDLIRVLLAINGGFGTKSEAIRRLAALGVRPQRIAILLAVPAGDVHSALAKAKKRGVSK